MNRILLVEDDRELGDSLSAYLKAENFEVYWATTLQKAGEVIQNTEVHLVILDWMLPDGQGIDFLKSCRQENIQLPVIMLTARTELVDKIIGLETGADDYITKPFEPRELVARIRVQLRTPIGGDLSAANTGPLKIQVGDLEINTETRGVRYGTRELEMTKMEYELLKLLAETPNKVFSREEILNKVWGYENYPSTRTVDTHILQLRQKLSDQLFETIRGIGYRLVD